MSYCVSRHTGTGSVVELAMQKVTFFGNNRKSESNADIIRKPNVQVTHPCNWFTPCHPARCLLFDPRKFSTTTTPPRKLQITPHHAIATRKTTMSSAYYDKPCHRCLAISPRVSSWPPSPPIHDLHHQYLAARKPPEPRHDMQDPPLTQLRTLTPPWLRPPTRHHDTQHGARDRNRQPTSTTPQHDLQDPTTANPQPRTPTQRAKPPTPSPRRHNTAHKTTTCHRQPTATPQHGVQRRNRQPAATAPHTMLKTPRPPTLATPPRLIPITSYHAATPQPHLTVVLSYLA
ncbi:hypothetical protein EDB89DRAFT_1917595 [Lactarius sanguifluus]|nr:hypothetical protein EDB89DRAFT_1917595 [Lactarius sanguifluus]